MWIGFGVLALALEGASLGGGRFQREVRSFGERVPYKI